MIESIGKVRRLGGIAKTARKAAGAVHKYGEAAIFYRVDTDVCAALSRTDPAWDPVLHPPARREFQGCCESRGGRMNAERYSTERLQRLTTYCCVGTTVLGVIAVLCLVGAIVLVLEGTP